MRLGVGPMGGEVGRYSIDLGSKASQFRFDLLHQLTIDVNISLHKITRSDHLLTFRNHR